MVKCKMGNKIGMRKTEWIILVVYLILIVLLVIGFEINNRIKKQEQNQTNGTFEIYFSNETPEWFYEFSEDYRNLTINGKVCEVVPCECHKNNPMCLSICYYCEEDLENR